MKNVQHKFGDPTSCKSSYRSVIIQTASSAQRNHPSWSLLLDRCIPIVNLGATGQGITAGAGVLTQPPNHYMLRVLVI